MMPFIRELNIAILAMAPPFEARATAPATFREVMDCATSGRVVVWDGASDATIYGDARVNHAFRAWHDAARDVRETGKRFV